MSDKKRFFKNGILLTLVALSMRGVGLFASSFVSGAVGAEGVGLYTLIMTVYGFALTFATSGVSLAMTNLVAAALGKGDRAVGSVLRAGTLYALLFGGISSAVLFLFAPFFGAYFLADARAALPLRILALSLLPEALLSVFIGYFVGIRRVANNAGVQVGSQLLRLLLTVVLLSRADRENIAASCIILAVTAVLTDLFAFALAWLQFLLSRRKKEKGDGREAFLPVCRVALPLAVSAYLRSALLTAEHILIPKRLRLYGQSASDSLASYGVLHGMALPLVLYPMALLTSFASLLVPEFAEAKANGDGARMERMCQKSFLAALRYGIATAALLLLFSEELGNLFYHSTEAGRYIAMLAPVVPIMYLDHVTDQMLKGIGEQVASMWINITDSLLSVLLVWFLLPVLGVWGYAVMIIVMELYNFLLSLRRLRRSIRFRVPILAASAPPLISAALSAFASRRLFLMNGTVTTLPWMLLKILFFVCSFVACSTLFSVISDALFARKSVGKGRKCRFLTENL